MWEKIRRLELEISSLCNAACPQCVRHPTSSDFINPILSDKVQWTIDQVRGYLPKEDLVNIESYLFNGNFGDFITNVQALDIINYFYESSKDATFHINTNGSARTTQWWKDLAKIPKLKVSFAIDGLKDTHSLYRRNTDFEQILENAEAFISEGGYAEWVMTVFQHNEHQIDECRILAEKMHFSNFYPRYSYRGTSLVSNRGIPLYTITQSSNLQLANVKRTPSTIHQILMQEKEIMSKKKNLITKPVVSTPLATIADCESFRNKSIFVSADWFVVPCCYMGGLSFNNTLHWAHDDFINKLKKKDLDYSSFFVQNGKKVSDIVNFSWIYDQLQTDEVLAVCSRSCNKSSSPIRIAEAHRKNFDK